MELKPCPFCGSKAYIQSANADWFSKGEPHDFAVKCTNQHCGASTRYWWESKEKAIEAWNKRVSEQQLAEYEDIGLSPQDIKKQLSTYSSLLCEITHNKLSKTNYTLEAILSAIAEGETE